VKRGPWGKEKEGGGQVKGGGLELKKNVWGVGLVVVGGWGELNR